MTIDLIQKSIEAQKKNHNVLYESAENLLGCMIMNNNIIFQAELNANMFPPSLSKLYEMFLSFTAKKIKFDTQTVATEIMKNDYGFKPDYPMVLTDKVVTPANWEYFYNEMIKAYQFEKARCTYIDSFLDLLDNKNTTATVDKLTEELVKINEINQTRDFKTPKSELKLCIKDIETAYNRKSPIAGISSGINIVDAFSLGFLNQNLYIVGARPSQGKTALALTFLRNIAKQEIPVGMLSAESPAKQLYRRLIAQESRMDLSKIISGMLGSSDFNRISDATSKIYDLPIFIWDYPMTIPSIKSRARLMVKKYNVKIIFIDYIGQKIRQHKKYNTEREFLGDISSSLADLAKELNIPIVALAQLSRDSENQRPGMKDFYGSAQIEKDADCIMALFHKNGLNDDSGHDSDSKILFLKARDGKIGTANVSFRNECVLFEDR